MLRFLSIFLMIALFVSCQPTTPTCTPNRSLECSCGNGVGGYQVCQEDGIWGECICDEEEPARCGDGVISDESGEECDDGDTLTAPCDYGLTSCQTCSGSCLLVDGDTSYCGDLTIDSNNQEECDDGNQDTGDGCDASCRVEASDTCGDGQINGDDQCDDGNLDNLDGCNAACQLETGWSCDQPGSACTSECGDSLIAAGAEECDDGNTDPLDGCDENCQLEPCPETMIMTYQITGKFRITDTSFGLGDTIQDITPGEAIIRVRSLNGAPIEGSAELIALNFESHFVVATSLGPTVSSDIVTSTPTDYCGIAFGTLAGTNLQWSECVYGDGHGTTEWTPDNAASGEGCIQDYHSEGVINCDGSDFTCGQGGLSPGDNIQDDTHDQPANTFQLSADFESFEMNDVGGPPGSSDDKGVEIPNRSPSRTWLRLTGTRINTTIESLPSCLTTLPACQ